MLKKYWYFISHQGIKESMPVSVQKKIILANQISILLFLVLFTLLISISILIHQINFLLFIACSSILTIPLLNSRGLYKVTTFLMSIIFPINVLVFSTLVKLDIENHSIDILYYVFPRFLIFGGLIIPLILIDFRNKILLIAAILLNLTCLLCFDFFNDLLGVGFTQVNVIFKDYPLINYLILLPYFLILLGFVFLQRINLFYEKKVLELVDELEMKNAELNSQNEEIMAQRDEISTQRDEIEAQRDTVTEQKNRIEKIHLEVSQSISYATRIQTAILSETDILTQHFSEHFILFRPKDNVSGDFYWWAKVEDNIVITVADCTGHGVPGAFMSMLGTSFLREIVVKEYITNPSVILKRLRKEIIHALKQKGEYGEQKDGMDMALVSINTESFEAQFAGANNPLYIVKNQKLKLQSDIDEPDKLSDLQLEEIKGDKMPVAIFENMSVYSNHELKFLKGDCLYLMSDGFQDQFGGPKHKKFLSKNLKQLILSNSNLPMYKQKVIFDETLTNWIKGNEQVDDITIFGLRI